jgi:hypothetical protein
MAQIGIPNRPFASDLFTGFMLPDGMFVTMLGRQNINVHLTNSGAGGFPFSEVYVESVSHPGIAVTPKTHMVGALSAGAATALSWTADFKNCPPGLHFVSFIAEHGGQRDRIIKKIFVLGASFDDATGEFVAVTPEGVMRATFESLTQPRKDCCCARGTLPEREEDPPRDDEDPNCDDGREKERRKRRNALRRSAIHLLPDIDIQHTRDFVFCPPGYLPIRVKYEWVPTPPFAGQDGDLPFEDPWWKIVLCVLAVLLLIGAAIAEAVDGSGSVTVGGDTDGSSSPDDDCCGVAAGGGGTSYVAAGLVAAAAAAATAAGLSDERDAFQVGRDKTPPGPGEITLKEDFAFELIYNEPVTLGRPFSVSAKWIYTRTTDKTTYSHSQTDTNQNVHVASNYEITAPEFTQRDNPDVLWIVKAKFSDPGGQLFTGNALFVQCFLIGPSGQWHRFTLQDDGLFPDDAASDGEYSGTFNFRKVKAEKGLWQYFVIAQDVNDADQNLAPQEAAKIVGGMVLTNQLTISFTEDECRFVADGHVMVV